MYSDITGFILSGGKSSRMGENKSLLKLQGRSIIEITADLMKQIFRQVILISNEPGHYGFLNLPVYGDIYPGLGPLAGIHSALVNSKTTRNFIISCDMPLMHREVITFLTDYPTKEPITVARADGFIQQLCGIYDKRCLPASERLLMAAGGEISGKKGCRVLEMISLLGAAIIPAEEIPGASPHAFFNMNRPAEFEFVSRVFTERAK
ncbi:MAG: molybdenum cofactor guanylyltransferase [Methanococcaceae archaeon]